MGWIDREWRNRSGSLGHKDLAAPHPHCTPPTNTVHKHTNPNTNTQIHDTQIQTQTGQGHSDTRILRLPTLCSAHKYKYTNTQIQIHIHKYTTTQIHKYKHTVTGQGLLDTRIRILCPQYSFCPAHKANVPDSHPVVQLSHILVWFGLFVQLDKRPPSLTLILVSPCCSIVSWFACSIVYPLLLNSWRSFCWFD